MRRLLKAQLRVWHIVAVLLVISVMTTGVVLARGGDPATRLAASNERRTTAIGTDFLPSGKTRIAVSTSNDDTVVSPGGGPDGPDHVVPGSLAPTGGRGRTVQR